MKKSISVIIPAYNEEKNILGALTTIKRALRFVRDWEIIIVNDGSTDATAQVARKLAKNDTHIRVITHKKNMGIGASLRDGIVASKKEYVTQFHGDNDTSGESMKLMFQKIGKADFISAYTANPEARPFARQIISKVFVLLMNMLFGLNLRYYTGFFLCKTKLLQSIPLTSKGFAFYPEAKVRLIKAGVSYLEIPFQHTGRAYGSSKAISLKSFFETARTIARLTWDVYVFKINHTYRRGRI